MQRMEHTETIERPLHTVYNQWTQFEEFPHFMKGIKSVRQLGPTHLYWRAEIAGKELEWEAEIIDQIPDQRIVWHSISGVRQGGKVEFRELGPQQTEVKLVMEYAPEGVVETVGDAIGVTNLRVQGDLKAFKEFIEAIPAATGAWRGEVHRGEKTKDNSDGRP